MYPNASFCVAANWWYSKRRLFFRHYTFHNRSLFNDRNDGLAQDRSNSIANELELLQSCTKPSIRRSTAQYDTWDNRSSLVSKEATIEFLPLYPIPSAIQLFQNLYAGNLPEIA